MLEDLATIALDHEEIFDTDVRERLWTAAEAAVIQQRADYQLPEDFGMFSAEGNQLLRAALEFHFQRLREVFAVFELDTRAERLNSFLNPKVRSDENGYHVDDFFGHP